MIAPQRYEGRLRVRQATEFDRDKVAGLRSAWYAKSQAEPVEISPAAVWMLGTLDGEVVAAMAVLPPGFAPGVNGAWISDMYCIPGHRGVLGMMALADRLDQLPENKFAAIPAFNSGMLQIVKDLGGYHDFATIVKKEPLHCHKLLSSQP